MSVPPKCLIFALSLTLIACSEMPTVEVVPKPSVSVPVEPRNAVLRHDRALGAVLAYVEASEAQKAKDRAAVLLTALVIETARAKVVLGRASDRAVSSSGTVNGYPCGGSLPSCCTLQAESRGQPTAQNPTSSSSGLWQFLDSTWAGYGGYQHAADAPASVQNERAAQVFAGGRGASNWFGDGCYGGR